MRDTHLGLLQQADETVYGFDVQAKNAVYRHATAHDPLGERWEQEVDRMQPRAGALNAPVLLFLLALLHPQCRSRPCC